MKMLWLKDRKSRWQLWVFLLTFGSYVCFHALRKAFTCIKVNLTEEVGLSTQRLGFMDTMFMFAYAFGLYLSGALGDRFNLRRLISIGMWASSGITILLALGGFMDVKDPSYFLLLWTLNGLIQSAGWPANVAVMGNWFAADSRGAIMGVWSGNGPFGNIVGALLVNLVLFGMHSSWEWALVGVSICAIVMSSLVFWYLPSHPADVKLKTSARLPTDREREQEGLLDDGSPQLDLGNSNMVELAVIDHSGDTTPSKGTNESLVADHSQHKNGISFMSAWLLPGVLPYSLSFACLKLVNYSLFFWLPLFMTEGLNIEQDKSNNLSTLYDVGQIFGGVAAGYVSDKMGKRSPVMVFMLLAACVSLFFYRFMTTDSVFLIMCLVTLSGFLIGGPSNIISSAICADMGSDEAVGKDSTALATVTGIVDGTGSVGAAFGQTIISMVSAAYGWKYAFAILMFMCVASAMCLWRMFVKDCRSLYFDWQKSRKLSRSLQAQGEDRNRSASTI